MLSRIALLLLVAVLLGGCSGMVEYEHREFWRDAQLVYEDVSIHGHWDPSIDPGKSIVVYICDGAVPNAKTWRTTTAHGSSSWYKLQIPGDAKVGDVIRLTGGDGAIAYENFTGYTWHQLDRESPATARVEIITMTDQSLRARIDIQLTSVRESFAVPSEQWNRYPVHYKGTRTFTLQTDYREGTARMGRRIAAQIEAKKRAEQTEHAADR